MLIGLGGTGGKVLKEFRKTLYEEFHSIDPSKKTGKLIKSLYIDSSQADLKSSESWRTQGDIGADISLNEESRFSITTNNLAQRLKDPQNNQVTHRYIGNPALWSDIFSSMNISETAGGQMRRLGVALLEPKMVSFVDQITRMCKSLEQESKKAEVSFHIFAGLAGGTGSGSFLHIIAQLRALYRESSHYPIYLYLLLPEKNSPWASNGEKTNYYANGYAALSELNAYLISDSQGAPLFTPIDLTGKTTHFENQAKGGETLLKNRLQGCFLISNTNENNYTMNATEIPQLIAQLVYQRIFLIDEDISDKNRSLRDAISLENSNEPDESKKSNQNIKLRSVNFKSFGIKRVIIPEEEIKEHFSAQFASQAALQMLYNNWPENSTEFINQSRKVSFKEFVNQEENRKLWKISTEQIKLEAGILEEEINAKRAWKNISQDWGDIIGNLKKDAWEYPHDNAMDNRLDILQERFTERYEESFRGLGVEKFYNLKKEDLTKADRHIAEVRNTIEDWMLQEWKEGRLSARDLEVFLDDLLEDLKTRFDNIRPICDKLENSESSLKEKIIKNREIWGQIGFFGRTFMSKRENIFEAQSELLRELYERQTLSDAWHFAERFLSALIAELRDKLKEVIRSFHIGLDKALVFFDTRIQQTVKENETDVSENIVKFYEPRKVRSFIRTLLQEKTEQESWAGKVRHSFIDAVRDKERENKSKERYFSSLVVNGIQNGEIKRVLENISRQNAENAHTKEAGEREKVIGVNIIEKMSEHFSDEKSLEKYVLDLVRSAQTFMKYDNNEFDGGSGPKAVMAILLPLCPQKADFRNRLEVLFKASQTNGVGVNIIDTHTRNNEVTLITFKYTFPLRFLEPVHDLKEKYDYRLSKGAERGLLEVHIEDHHPELPSLFRPQTGQAGKEILPLLQLATALKLFSRAQNPYTGKWERILEVLNIDGIPEAHIYFDDLIALLENTSQASILEPNTFQDLLNKTTEVELEILQDAVDKALSNELYRVASNRDTLQEAIREQISAVKANRKNNIHDEIYKVFLETTQTAINIVKSIY